MGSYRSKLTAVGITQNCPMMAQVGPEAEGASFGTLDQEATLLNDPAALYFPQGGMGPSGSLSEVLSSKIESGGGVF
ncbi:MAG: hypothetical protein GY792_23535 [Gammaproteobacteria bacterium]|nr:hypothetical protein [Gammaproteobacteria bacterium]